MVGLGTLTNSALIVVGGLLGILFKKHLTESLQKSLMHAMGVAVSFIAIGGALSKMLEITSSGRLEAKHTIPMVVCLALGILIGEWLGIADWIEHLGEWLKVKTGNSGDSQFVNAFVTATCTVSIGAMAIVGSIQDGALGDSSTLIAKAVIDMVIIAVMATSLGRGAIFSALPVLVLEGSITLIAFLGGQLIQVDQLNLLSLVGNLVIFCVGVNLLFDKNIKVANMLPSLVIALVWGMMWAY